MFNDGWAVKIKDGRECRRRLFSFLKCNLLRCVPIEERHKKGTVLETNVNRVWWAVKRWAAIAQNEQVTKQEKLQWSAQ